MKADRYYSRKKLKVFIEGKYWPFAAQSDGTDQSVDDRDRDALSLAPIADFCGKFVIRRKWLHVLEERKSRLKLFKLPVDANSA